MSARLAVQARIREVAGGLLRGGRVDVFLGFRKSGLPFRARPVVLHSADHVESLVWNSFCTNSLSAYLAEWIPAGVADRDRPGVRVGLAAKPCDARAALRLVAEGALPRESLFLVGIRCPGMLDWGRASATLAPREALGTGENDGGDVRVVVDDGSEVTLARSALLHRVCRECRDREPEGCDCVLDGTGGWGEAPPVRPSAAVPSDEELAPRVAAELARCMGCGSCRSVCPMIGDGGPAGFGLPEDPLELHAERFRRLVGRCVSCGACDRACPADVDTLLLARPTPSGRSPLDLLRARDGGPGTPGGSGP